MAFSVLLIVAMAGPAAYGQGIPGQAASGPGFAACPDSATTTGEIDTPCLAIVDFNDDVIPANRQGIIRGAGAIMRFGFGVMNAAAAMVPNVDAYWSLALNPSVTRLYPDRPVHAIAPSKCSPWPACKNGTTSTDPASVETIPEGVARIGADSVWSMGITGAGVHVAVIDTGLDSGHPDLSGNISDGTNCLGDGNPHGCDDAGSWEDDAGHGTHVGGIIAAVRGNDLDVAGVAPNAKLHAVKVLDSSGSGYESNVIAGIEWAAAHGSIGVANMSLGGTGDCLSDSEAPMRAAIQDALDANISVVVAAGNDSSVEIGSLVPAGCPGVIAVASTTAEDGQNKCKRLSGNIPADTASYFTTDGAGVTVSAPGEAREDNSCAMVQSVGILSLAMGGGTVRMSGTSMAAPHVAGVVALMLQANGALTPASVKSELGSTAALQGTAPLTHPYVSQSFDGVREGIVDAPTAVAAALTP